jgi:hypothetical protein
VYIICILFRHPIAVFHLKKNNYFAVWNLSLPGHPRHIVFNIPLPMAPWRALNSSITRSNWIITIQESDKTNFICMNLSIKSTFRNSFIPCECLPPGSSQDCFLVTNRLTLKANRSTHVSKISVYFIGERFVIQKTSQNVYIRDCWKAQKVSA